MKSVLLAATALVFWSSAACAATELPVESGVVTSGVGLRLDPFGSGKLVFHRGIDIAVPVGTPVRAVRPGQVVFAGVRSGYGSTVVVEHRNGDRTLYGHNASLRVQPGELVTAGAVLALSGNSGRSTGPHVHFELVPSGRPEREPAGEDSVQLPVVAGSEQRRLLELKMDETVNTVLRTINRRGTGGQGG